MDADKTRVYLERSKASPINLWIDAKDSPSLRGALLQVVPHAIDRLKSLSIKVAINVTLDDLQYFFTHLSRSVPLLEYLLVDGSCECMPGYNPVLTTALFNGDLSSLRVLHLRSVRTDLLWRNMVNLTSLALAHTLPGDITVGKLLEFFESAPRLRDIFLLHATPTSSAQNGRLVSLACLKNMEIVGYEPSSLLLDHLVLPVGAELTTRILSHPLLVESHLPESLGGLKNLSNFTEIDIRLDESNQRIGFMGPNGGFSMVTLGLWPPNLVQVALQSLTRFDTSKTERMGVFCTSPPPRGTTYRALLPMGNLRSLTISRPESHYVFVTTLDPSLNSSGVMVCPKLEELVLSCPGDASWGCDVERVIAMAGARASRGTKLKSVVIIGRDNLTPVEERELRTHVLRLVCEGQRRQ